MKEFMHTRLDNRNFTDEDIKGYIKEYNIKFIKLQFVDINGQVKNLSIPSEHIEKFLQMKLCLTVRLSKALEALKHQICTSIPIKTVSRFYPGEIKTEYRLHV